MSLNTTKTKQIILDFRKHRTDPSLFYIQDDCVERFHTFTFLGTMISANLSWSANTSAVIKKAQQHLHFLTVLRKNICEKLLVTFCNSTIKSILTYCITVWFSRCTVAIGEVSSEWSRQHKRSSDAPSLPSKTFRLSHETAPILHITCLSCYPLAGSTSPSKPELTVSHSFFPQAIAALNINGHWHWHTHTTQGQCAKIVKTILLYLFILPHSILTACTAVNIYSFFILTLHYLPCTFYTTYVV